ncbi:MAG: hypothetical protein ACJ0F1_04385 [Crocinitomicaceae bacterium]
MPALPKPNNELDRSLNAQEIYEEKAVVASFSGYMEFIKDHRNRHIRDQRIQFNAEQHKYFIDGIPVPSASSLIRKFFPELMLSELRANFVQVTRFMGCLWMRLLPNGMKKEKKQRIRVPFYMSK